MKRFTLFAFLLLCPIQAFAGFNYYRSKTAVPAKVLATQTNYTGIIHLTLNTAHVANANGFDIRPYLDATCTTTPVTFYLISYNSGTGDVWLAVQIASMTTTTVVDVCYGNGALATDGSSAATFNANYRGAFPLGNGTVLSAADAKGLHNGTIQGTVTATTGQIDGAASFNGNTANYILGANTTDYNFTTAMTLSAIVKTSASAFSSIMDRDDVVTAREFQFRMEDTGALGMILFDAGANLYTPNTGATHINDGAFHYVSWTYDGSNLCPYIGGSLVGSCTATMGFNVASGTGVALNIGRSPQVSQPWNGVLNWLTLEAFVCDANCQGTRNNNYMDEANFWTTSSENILAAAGGCGPGLLGICE